MSITKALIVADPWIEYLLNGTKDWEMRSSGASHRGWFGLIRKGSGAVHTVCCYPTASAFIKAHAAKIMETWAAAGSPQNVRLLFSAHGLPERVVQQGDPYQTQVERTAAAVAAMSV